MIIGYFVYNDYVIEIEVLNNLSPLHDINIINAEYATYHTTKYKIISITNFLTMTKVNSDESNYYKINNINEHVTMKIDYVLNKDIAIYNTYNNPKNSVLEYLKNKSGIFRNYHKNGQIKIQVYHNNGIFEGEYIYYYIDGSCAKITNFINGILHGKCIEYFYNGQIALDSNYINGNLDGKYRSYYKNSNLKIICNYKNGLKNGLYIEYHQNKNKFHKICHCKDGNEINKNSHKINNNLKVKISSESAKLNENKSCCL